jgi:hypothetical protein
MHPTAVMLNGREHGMHAGGHDTINLREIDWSTAMSSIRQAQSALAG